MAKVIINGFGQCSTGTVLIEKTLDIDDAYSYRLTGLNRDEELKALLAIHYPGVVIEPNHIGLNILY